MKRHPTSGLLAFGVFALTFVNAVQAQNPSSEHELLTRRQTTSSISCFSQVKERVLAGNPLLGRESATLRSLRAQAQQAALLPNPVITFEAENFGGSQSGDDLEYTAGVSQLIETANKRRARTLLAKTNADAFELRRDIATAELLARARVAYAEVIAAKARLALSEKEVAIRRKAQRLISRKSSHGGALRLEVDKAEVALQSAEVVRDRRVQELQIAKRTLTSLWGANGSDVVFTNQVLRLHKPELELSATVMQTIPDVAYATAKREAATKSAGLQRALAVPDITVSAGYRRFDATDDHAFVADIAIPLPLFDRNQFATQGADERLKASQFDLANTQIAVDTELQSLRDRLRVLLRERNLLQKRLLPQTERVLTSSTDAYRLGRISYLNYLDAQTTYLERRERLTTVTLSAIRNQVEIQRLNGTLQERLIQMDQGECYAQ